MRTRLAALLCLLACSSCRSRADVDRTAPSASTAARDPYDDLQPASPPSPPTQRTYQASFANFRDDVLDECVDFSVALKIPPDAGAGWRPAKDPIEVMGAGLGKTATRVPKVCAEQFGDRLGLASCVMDVTPDGGAIGGQITIRATYYNFATVVGDDTFMKQCFKEGGDWNALPKDSDKYARAKHEHDMAKNRKALEKLQKQIGN